MHIREIILGMHIVAIAWIYVVGMASVVEAFSPRGTVLGAVLTFVFWGVLPLSVVLYLFGTPARKRARRRTEMAALQASAGRDADRLPLAGGASALEPDGRGHAAGGTGRLAAPVAPEREEP